MERIYHIGECPICRGYGRMELYYNISSNMISAICEECELEFDSVRDYNKNINGHRVLNNNDITTPLIRPATIEEIEYSEWYSYVIDKF